MIDVVFQLLAFFMFTFKIAVPEGDFTVNMPLTAPAPGPADEEFQPELKVRLVADEAGTLATVFFNQRALPGQNPEQLIQSLRDEIRAIVALVGTGDPLDEELEVEIDADYHLSYQYTMAAITACSGQMVEVGPGRYQLARYIEKIKFAPPRRPDTIP